MSFAASFNVPSPSTPYTTTASHHSYAYSAHHPHSDRGNARGPPAPVTTSTNSHHHWSADSSPVSASSSPATASSWPTPPPALPSSHITLPPPPPHHQRLPPIRPPSDYFSLFTRSPPAYHHPILDKMSMSSVMTPQPGELPKIMGSMTSKEWVVPPRPKPGRKPATDTPPTKRKAQNRAAQRAFRERRAARVGELEEQLDQQKEDNDKKEQEYKDRIRDLEMELQSYKSRYEVLEGMLERERQDRVKAETDLEGFRRSSSRQNNFQSQSHSHSQSNTPPQLPSIASQLNSAHSSPLVDSSTDFSSCGSCGVDGRCACAESIIQTVEPTGCGKCGPSTNCECLEEVVKTAMPDLKRAPSPSLASAEKRQRANPSEFAHEIDFTSFFKKPQTQPQPQPQALPSISTGPPKDPCGFCQDGGYCFCADNSTRPVEPTTAPPPYSQQTTPPPSEDDVVPPMPLEINPDGAVKLRPRQPAMAPPPAPAARSCGPNGPGTCAQCVADPISGLFCRALSASLQRKGQSSGGCCGGAGRDGGCCKTGQAPPKLVAPKPGLGLSLSCAEAYQTLSSHRNFDKATDDIGSWLPKLRAVPRMGETLPSPTASRLPIEVEAASIMSVLKDFDIRFGRGL
jgi:Hap4-like Hap2/3/5-binding protein